MEKDFDIHKWQAKYLRESVEFKAIQDPNMQDDVPSITMQIIDDHEQDSPKLYLQVDGVLGHDGTNGKIQILKDNPQLQQQVLQTMQTEVQKTFRRVIHSILGEPYGLDEDIENKVTTLADILKNKGTLNHLEGMYLRILDGPFTEKRPEYKDKGCTLLFYDAREGLVGVKLEDGKGVNLYPKELRIDVERFNAR